MNEIAKRLHEHHRLEDAKQILEDAGYEVKKLKESVGSQTVYQTLLDLGIDYDDISEDEEGTISVSNDRKAFSPQIMKKVWDSMPKATNAGMSDRNHTIWFTF